VRFPAFLIYLLAVHYLADFVFQSDRMAKNKSKSWRWLSYHIAAYTGVLMVAMLIFPALIGLKAGDGWQMSCLFAVVNGGAHFIVDALSSRLSSHFYQLTPVDPKANHRFWLVIGADQLIHTATLVWTASLLMGGS
jgi:hypothetical protein